jgi:hypothetical protein
MESELNQNEINELNEIFLKYNIKKPKYLRKYYDLFINGITFNPNEQNVNKSGAKLSETELGEEYYYLGCFYRMIGTPGHIIEMSCIDCYGHYTVDNFITATNYGNIYSIIEMGIYYEYINFYGRIEKYYLMAIEKGSTKANRLLGMYYLKKLSNIKLGWKYCFLYIKKKPKKIYKILEKIVENTIFLRNSKKEVIYDMIKDIIDLVLCNNFEHNNLVCLVSSVFQLLSEYYILNDNCKGDITNLDKFLIHIYKIINGKGKQKLNVETIKQISDISSACEILINMDIILKIKYEEHLHEKYKPGGKGYFKAKEDFEKRSGTNKEKEKR